MPDKTFPYCLLLLFYSHFSVIATSVLISSAKINILRRNCLVKKNVLLYHNLYVVSLLYDLLFLHKVDIKFKITCLSDMNEIAKLDVYDFYNS